MASKHLVICVKCGKQFDANIGGYYNSHSRRYTCKSCGKAIKSATKKHSNKKQTKLAMILKIVFGILFVCAGFSSPDGGWSIGYFLTAIVIGALLIYWGLKPYLKGKNISLFKSAQQPNDPAIDTKTCPSCGTVGTGSFCNNCGTEYTK